MTLVVLGDPRAGAVLVKVVNRLAPSDTRTAISRWRAAARASSMPPRLAHVRRSKTATMAMTITSGFPNCWWRGVENPDRAGSTSSVTLSHCGSLRASSSIVG